MSEPFDSRLQKRQIAKEPCVTGMKQEPVTIPVASTSSLFIVHRTGDPEARRQLLQALAEAPRCRAPLHLVLEIQGQTPPANADQAKLNIRVER